MKKIFNPYSDLFQIIQKLPETERLAARKALIWAYSWAVPTSEIVSKLIQYSPLIELGAGTGYWGWLIHQAGGKIKCFDQDPLQPPRWIEIHKGGPETVQHFSEETLFMCWPPLDDPMSTQALLNYNGNFFIYIGEWRGRTGENAFHDELEQNWTLIETLNIPNWPGFTDQVFIFSRKERMHLLK